MFERAAQFVIADERAAAGPAEAKAFVDPHQRGRRIDVNAQVCGFQNRPQIGDRRPLAIGAGATSATTGTISAGIAIGGAGFDAVSMAGDLLSKRQSRASVGRRSWRCTTMSIMP